MKPTAIIGLGVLAIAWIWLSWGVLSTGITLYNLLIVGISGVIIFAPLWRKYGYQKNSDKDKGGKSR